jgi:DNA-binding MarR family transcriptional regulator
MADQHVGIPLVAVTLGADTHTMTKASSFHITSDELDLMKRATPLLLPLLRTRAQGDILAAILLQPEEEQSLSDVARLVEVSPATVLREIDRLEKTGLVSTRRLGNTRLARARRTTLSTLL